MRAAHATPDLHEILDELIGDHAEIRLRVAQMQQFIERQIFPLQEPARVWINDMVEHLSVVLAAHAGREDDRVYPAYRSRNDTCAEDTHDNIG